MVYREYDPATLARLKAVELMMLADFNTICRRHGIDYFCGGGTAIGAVRHGGMIPWDDDIDIIFTPEHYARFLAVAETEFPGKYVLLNAQTHPQYPLMTTRWMLAGTRFVEACFKDAPFTCGIFLDLFCYHNLPDDPRVARRQWLCAWFWGKLMILRAIGTPMVFVRGWRGACVKAACRVLHYAMRLARVSPAFLLRQATRVSERYDGVPTRRLAYFFDTVPFKSVSDLDEIFPTREMPFDTTTIRAPRRIEAYLKRRFGDYMTLPPENKRHNHPPHILDFGPCGNPSPTPRSEASP